MLGLPKGEVFLCDYTDEWEKEFEKESKKVLDLIGRYVSNIHHIGSTTVPGLKAKPIIDIAVELFNFEGGFLCVEALQNIGYRHQLLPELPERHYFSKGVDLRTHQIHMYKPGSKYLHEQLTFRNKLRADPFLVEKYVQIKDKLSKTFYNDKLAYTDAKTEFIEAIINAP